MNLKTLFFVSVFLLIISVFAFAQQDQYMGAKEINLDGGVKGKIDFPHQVHQDALGDCSICHSMFPMKQGTIKDLIAQGILRKKKVMNKTCLKCHRAMKKTGKATGPVSCSKCHIK
jgi:hypothetical protein